MADDGMLLNFDLSNIPITAKVAFKGGRWKDRVFAKKSARRRQNEAWGGRQPGSDRTIFNEKTYQSQKEEYIGPEPASRPAKRQRVNDEGKTAEREPATKSFISGKLPAGSISIGRAKDGADGKPPQVISSLFRRNPA